MTDHTDAAPFGEGSPADSILFPRRTFRRAKELLASPGSAWHVIREESVPVPELLVGYVSVLASAAALAYFVGITVVGFEAPGEGRVVLRPAEAAAISVLGFLFNFVLIFVSALVAAKLAPRFRGRSNVDDAVRLVCYSMTPYWLGSLLAVTPAAAPFGILLGVYGFYLFYRGVPAMTGVPEERSAAFSAVAFLAFLAAVVLFAGVSAAVVSALRG